MQRLSMESPTLDADTVKLANEIQTLLGTHILKFKDQDYQATLISCLSALALEVGRLRFLVTETEEVDVDKFDALFFTGVKKHFDEHKRKHGGAY